MNKFLSLFLGVLVMMSCSAQNAESFKGKMYQLQAAPDNAEITLGFGANENRIFGVAAINNYFGSYQQDGDKLTLNLVGSTMMAGPEELMKAEQDYLQTLPAIVANSR